jgi:hypothetical protein
MNDITTWAQGFFVDGPQHRSMTDAMKSDHEKTERCSVRPSPTGNVICRTPTPCDAKWIAGRLNLASQLEQMTYDFAMGKTDGSEIVALVRKNV